MKKLLILAVTVCLALTFGLTAMAATDDFVLFDGTGVTTSADFGWHQGLTDVYGIPAPEMASVDGKLQATLTASNWVQTYYPLFKDALKNELIAGAGSYQYLKMYFENNTNSDLAFNASIGADGLHGSFSAADAKVVLLDGTQANATPVAVNAEGQEVSHISIPVDFKGWIYLPISLDKLVINTQVSGWGLALLTSYDQMTKIELDIRPTVTDGFEGTQVIGTIALAKTIEEITAEPEPTDTTEPEPTADMSVVAYAAAAITGLGSLVVIRRKNNK